MRQKGFGLIELLTAITIFAIATLGLARLQLHSLRQSRDALQLSLATTCLSSLNERIHAQSSALSLNKWQAINKQILPSSRFTQQSDVTSLIWIGRSQETNSLKYFNLMSK